MTKEMLAFPISVRSRYSAQLGETRHAGHLAMKADDDVSQGFHRLYVWLFYKPLVCGQRILRTPHARLIMRS